MPSNFFYKTTLFAGNCVSHAVHGHIGLQNDSEEPDIIQEGLVLAKNSTLSLNKITPSSIVEHSSIELFSETLILLNLHQKISGYSIFFLLTSRMDYFFFTIRNAKFLPLYFSTIQPLIPIKRQLIYAHGGSFAISSRSFIAILLSDIELKVFSYELRGIGKERDPELTVDKPWSLHIVNKKPVLDLAVISHQFRSSDPCGEYLTILHGGCSAGTGSSAGRSNDPKPYNLSTYKLNLSEKKFDVSLEYSSSVFDMSGEGKHLAPDKLQRIVALKNTIAVFGQFSLRLFRSNSQYPIAYSTFMASDFNTIVPVPNTSCLLVACKELKTLYQFHIDDSSLVKPVMKSTLLATPGVTSAICPLPNGLIFLGSIIDNSSLIKTVENSLDSSEENPKIAVLESFQNFGPITHLEMTGAETKGKQLLAVAPWRQQAQLLVLNHSLRVDTLFQRPLKNIKMMKYLESFSVLVLSTESLTAFIRPNESPPNFIVDRNSVIRTQCITAFELQDSIAFLSRDQLYFIHPFKLRLMNLVGLEPQFGLKNIIKAHASKTGELVVLDAEKGLHVISGITKEGKGSCRCLGEFNAQSFVMDESLNIIVAEWFKNSISIVYSPTYTTTEPFDVGENCGVADILSCSLPNSETQMVFLAFSDGVLRSYSGKNGQLDKKSTSEFHVGSMEFKINLLEATTDSITILVGHLTPQIITFYPQTQRTLSISLQLEGLLSGTLVDLNSPLKTTEKKKAPKLICYATKKELIIANYNREHKESISSREIKKENKIIKKCAFLPHSSDIVVIFGDYIPSKSLPNPMLQSSMARNCCMFASITELTNGQDYTEELFPQIQSINMLLSDFDDRFLVVLIGKQVSSEIDELINNSQKYCVKFGTLSEQVLSKHWDSMIFQEPATQIERFKCPGCQTGNMYTLLVGYGVFKFLSVKKKVGLEDQLIIEELFSFNSHSYVRYFVPIQNSSRILVAEMYKAIVVFQVNIQGKRMFSVSKGATDAGSSLSCAVLGKNKYLSIDDKGNLSVYGQEVVGKSDRAFFTLSNLGKVCLNSRCYSILKTKENTELSLVHSMHLQKYLGQNQDAVIMASVKGEVFSFQSMNEKLFMNLTALQNKIIDHMQRNHPLYSNLGKTKVDLFPFWSLGNNKPLLKFPFGAE